MTSIIILLDTTIILLHDVKVTSDKKMIFNSYQRNKGGNEDYCSHFSLIFETASKFPIAFLRLVFGKAGVDGVTRPRREIDVRYESEDNFKGLREQREILAAVFD